MMILKGIGENYAKGKAFTLADQSFVNATDISI